MEKIAIYCPPCGVLVGVVEDDHTAAAWSGHVTRPDGTPDPGFAGRGHAQLLIAGGGTVEVPGPCGRVRRGSILRDSEGEVFVVEFFAAVGHEGIMAYGAQRERDSGGRPAELIGAARLLEY